MNQEIKQWFIEKIAQNPEYLERTYLPELDKAIAKAELSLQASERQDDLMSIKYHIGWLDGMKKIVSVIDGLRISERTPKSEPGLMARIFSRNDEARI